MSCQEKGRGSNAFVERASNKDKDGLIIDLQLQLQQTEASEGLCRALAAGEKQRRTSE